ncbi:MAG: NYN domain-containing protein [Planctomycetota bacterium]
MNATAAVFIDGGYLDKVMYYDFQNTRVDYGKLAHELASPCALLRAYYYHCLPYRSDPPTEEEERRYQNKLSFFQRLEHLPRFQVRLGRLVKRGLNAQGEPIFIQKRVDCMVGVDMALLAAKGKITNVCIFSGDSDLIPAVEAAKRESIVVTLWHGSQSSEVAPSPDLYAVCDERRQLTRDIIERILLNSGTADVAP